MFHPEKDEVKRYNMTKGPYTKDVRQEEGGVGFGKMQTKPDGV